MSCSPVLAKFLVDIARPAGHCAAEVASAICLCQVAGFLSIINSGLVSPAELGETIVNHLTLHK
eukprot:4887396-Pyramimonas_sp.AAC.1